MGATPRWTVAEAALTGSRDDDNPFRDVTVRARLTAPSGRQRATEAFWDGGRAWRLRFCPDEVGAWRWDTACSDATDTGLQGQGGAVERVPYLGDNPLYRHGAIRVPAGGYHFVHVDDTPFFWLGDTAWNGVIRARGADWDHYLATRQGQGFTAVQFVSTQWRGCSTDSRGETAFGGTGRIRLNPGFFRRLDAKVAAINAHGLLAAPVILWAIGPRDPGRALAEEDAIRLARYIVARWGAHHVAWLLGGDGDYRGERAERWRRLGRAVFGGGLDRPATMHPGGQQWVGDEFRREAWCNFIGYQSGHGSSPEHLRWLVGGPPASDWRTAPPRPVVNLEPNYEAHRSYHLARHFTDREIRHAAYWSLLVAPPAGVAFGHNAIWPWSETEAVPEGHPKLGLAPPWPAGLDTPGTRSMAVRRRFFAELPRPWWGLRPAPELLAAQPGEADPERFVAAARTDGGDLAVLYLPVGGAVGLRAGSLRRPAAARWFDPRAGAWRDAGAVADEEQAFAAPDGDDWLLCLAPTDGHR